MGRPPKSQAAAPPPKTSNTAIWKANPGPQRALFQCPADIILFGGAAGGGKTDSMIIDGVRGTVHDGYRGIIFRRTFPELEKHIIERSHVLFSGLGRYNDKKHCWAFPTANGGKSLLYFGYLEQDKDVFAYHGGEFQFIGFDESTMFCLHPSTEVLTENGWKKIEEVSEYEKVPSLNPDFSVSWRPVTKTHRFKFDGVLKSVTGRKGLSFQMTSNHRLPILNEKGGWSLRTFDSLPQNFRVARGGRWKGQRLSYIKPPKVKGRGLGRNQNSVEKISASDWFSFVGWYLSEGSSFESTVRCKTRSPSTRGIIQIAQLKRVSSLEKLFDSMGFRWSKAERTYLIYSRQLLRLIQQEGLSGNLYEKRMPRWMLNCDPKLLRLLCECFVSGDGNIQKGGGITITLANEGLIDDLQESYIRLGIHATKRYREGWTTLPSGKKFYGRAWTLSIAKRPRNFVHCRKSDIVDESYTGDVFCLTVPPNGNFLVRHRGRCHWTGNSEFQVRFMLTRLRSTIPGIRRRMLLSSNPIGPGFGFHKLMFVERINAQGEAERLVPGRVYKDATWPSDGRPVLKSTCFIPATVYDNPILLKADPGYIDNIRSQSGPLAKALLTGSWNEAISVAVVFDKKVHTVSPDAPQGEARKPAFVNALAVNAPGAPSIETPALRMWQIPPTAPRWIGLDWGKTDKACAVWQTAFDGRIYWYRDHARPGKVIRSYAEEVVARSVGETIAFVVLSHECFAEHGENHTQADQFIEVFSKAGIPVIKSGRDPEGRLMLLREFLRVTRATTMEGAGALDDYEYWQKEIEKRGDKAWREYSRLKMLAGESDKLPRLQIFTSGGPGLNFGCPYIIKTLPLLTVDIEKPKQLAKGQDDHGFDAATTGLKFYLQHDETALIEAYQKQLGGVMPESGFQAEMAMKAALEAAENGDGEEMTPFQMESDKFDDGSGGKGPF